MELNLYTFMRLKYICIFNKIKSLLKFGSVKKEINYESIYDYLTFQNIFGTKTLFKNISLMPKGSIVVIQNNKSENITY